MSATRLRPLTGRSLALCALATGLLFAGAAGAEPPGSKDGDLLDRTRRLTDIAAQKKEAQVRQAVRDAQRLSLTNLPRAVDRLKKALAGLEDDTALSARRRETLASMLRDRIRVMEADAKRPADPAPNRVEAAGRRADAERKSEEAARVKKSLESIRDLQRDGRTEEARREAEDLARRNPDNPAAQAAGRRTSVADNLAAERELRRKSESGYLASTRDVQRSAIPPRGDIEFPDAAKWREMTKRRQKDQVQLTAKEKSILQALSTPVTVNFKDSRLEDVIEYLATLTGQPIVVEKAAMEEAQITYDTPVTLRARGLSVRTILHRILGEFGLEYVVQGEAIQVTTAVKARQMMVVRAYYLGDLVGNDLTAFRFGPGLSQLQAAQNAATIIELIQSTVDPDSWKANGGQGTISYNAATRSLVVKQSSEVHSMLGGSLFR